MKVAAVVILYHPTENTLSNVHSYLPFIEKLYVYDNSETTSAVSKKISLLEKIKYCSDGQNLGIAARLNAACKLAKLESFHWLLTMDQDTHFSKNMMQQYLNCFYQYKEKDNIALFGPEFRHDSKPVSPGCQSIFIEKLITSGALLNLHLFDVIGNFDEQLFIDAVDYDYCFRADMAGYKMVMFTNIFITHTIGTLVQRSSIKSLFLKKKKKLVHTPIRCYYMFRNLLYLRKKYKNENDKYIKEIEDYVLPRIKTNIYYGRQTIKIAKYLLLAYLHAKEAKYGKLII